MAQFDVHANQGRHRAAIPFVVILQSSRFDASRRRVVAPRRDAVAFGSAVRDSSAAVMLSGRRTVPDPLQIQAIPREAPGERVASLADGANAGLVRRALDALFSRAVG
ncbi:MAG: CcdB family protein [Rubritepida sp.]|nr:CcdB family protein [Rubritepida sp.]